MTAREGCEGMATPATAGAGGRRPAPRLINRLRPAPLESLVLSQRSLFD